MPTDSPTTDDVGPVSLRNGVFVVVIALQFVLVLVNGSTTMALPSIRDGLGATNSELQWYASLFALTFSLVLVLSGRLGDLFGCWVRALASRVFGAREISSPLSIVS